MKLRGIEFGNILGASGVQGFFGDPDDPEYWFHRALWFWLHFSGMTFVSKSATLVPRAGNMKLTRRYKPKSFFPDCIKVDFIRGITLNAIGLSNPGIWELLRTGKWQKRQGPFMISIVPMGNSTKERVNDLQGMLEAIAYEMTPDAKQSFSFGPVFGIQINVSCPNTESDPTVYVKESIQILDTASWINVPIMLKFSVATTTKEDLLEIQSHPNLDGICLSNTVPYGWRNINWKNDTGWESSPLKRYGGGGLGGALLRKHVCRRIRNLRAGGFVKPINGGGGIDSIEAVNEYHAAGADSISIASVALTRPRRVPGIIQHANSLDWRR
jgi:dihydroorotate dehydrogenase